MDLSNMTLILMKGFVLWRMVLNGMECTKLIKMKTLILFTTITLAISCQLDTGFQDLTPDDGHRDHYYFNTLKFEDALLIEPGLPDTVFEISQPDYLIDRSIFTYDRKWYTTDTFAFDPGDFDLVISTLTGTILEADPKTTYPTSDLSQIILGNRIAWSRAGKFWIVRWGTAWIQISREKVGSGWFARWKYTANAVWMEAKLKDPDGDAS